MKYLSFGLNPAIIRGYVNSSSAVHEDRIGPTLGDVLGRIRPTFALGLTAFAVRMCLVLWLFAQVGPERFWLTGFEASRIGDALASGAGFSSPFGIRTGATAWVPPVYPLIVATAFKLFGSYSAASAFALLVVNAVAASLTTVLIYRLAAKLVPSRIAVFPALIWAAMPYSVGMTVKLWDTSISALLVVATIHFHDRFRIDKPKEAIAYGAWWAAIALTNTALMVLLPTSICLRMIGAKSKARAIRHTFILCATCAVVVLPWLIRNELRLGKAFPVRSNFGVELWLGNHEGVLGPADETMHPLGNRAELNAYSRMGESAYVSYKMDQAFAFIEQQPATFIRLTLLRIVHFWTSPRSDRPFWTTVSVLALIGSLLAVYVKQPHSAFPILCLMTYPVVYCVTHADNWYRHPIEPVMLIFSTYAIAAFCRQFADYVSIHHD